MAFTRLMPTGDLLCPRWCITYKKGKSEGRHGCYGRMWFDEIQSTVVGRAEPHNLRLVHPYQHRVATIRENARCQVRSHECMGARCCSSCGHSEGGCMVSNPPCSEVSRPQICCCLNMCMAVNARAPAARCIDTGAWVLAAVAAADILRAHVWCAQLTCPDMLAHKDRQSGSL